MIATSSIVGIVIIIIVIAVIVIVTIVSVYLKKKYEVEGNNT